MSDMTNQLKQQLTGPVAKRLIACLFGGLLAAEARLVSAGKGTLVSVRRL